MAASASTSINKSPEKQLEYETIDNVIKNCKKDKVIDKINVYGVLTFIFAKPTQNSKNFKNYLSCSIVDNTCKDDEKLKFVVFSSPDETKTIASECEIGDIVRFHRIKIQEYQSSAQGVHNAQFSSWIRFKRNDTSFDFVGNKTNSSISDYDKQRVTELRDWLKTNPNLEALVECNLSIPPNLNDSGSSNQASARNSLSPVKSAVDKLNLVNLSNLPITGWFDMICQICAKGDSKGNKFLFCWDATKSKLAIHQESEFTIESKNDVRRENAAVDASKDNDVYYSKSNLDYLFQLYVFDEFLLQLDSFEPGDYILLKNIRSCKPNNSPSDTVIKLPGVVTAYNKFGRAIIKLASINDDLKNIDFGSQIVQSTIDNIKQKANDLKFAFHSKQEFLSEFYKKSKLRTRKRKLDDSN